jgi:hypothetical protein
MQEMTARRVSRKFANRLGSAARVGHVDAATVAQSHARTAFKRQALLKTTSAATDVDLLRAASTHRKGSARQTR